MESEETFGMYLNKEKGVIVFQIPFQKCVEDTATGTALIRGMMEEFKAVTLSMVAEERRKKAESGILRVTDFPPANPLLNKPELKVH